MHPRTALALAALLSLSAPLAAQEITLKVHHFLPPTAPAHIRFITPWCDKLGKESKGKLKCQIYPSMQLGGSAPQLYDQAKDGVVDVAWIVTGYTPGRFTKTEVFELPFMMTDPEGTARAMWEYVGTHSADEFKDVKLLAMHPHGPGVFHITKRPIKTMADLRRLKLRAPTRLTNKMIAMFGATPVGMPMPQVPEALSKGVIDGALMPWEVVPAMKVQELVKYHSETDPSQPAIYTTVFAFVMNRTKYDSLPADLKKVIDSNSGIELSAHVGKVFAEADAQGRKAAEGNPINVIPAAEIEKWKKAAHPVVDGWIREVDDRGADGTALLEAARALIAKHSKPR
jgi:TRAP-type C4-dicarboxylate transport system substrate-binding protein